mgnify:FL=1|tara:strand:+ start:1832 stop:2464 length:633 start_codon:yes stop_codon:yes gene_type:complete
MDCEKQLQKHNSKIWDILFISTFSEYWLNLLSHISFCCPDVKIQELMIKEYQNDKHKYNIKSEKQKLLFVHYFRHLIYGKIGFNWSSFVRLMDKLMITEYPTKQEYDLYYKEIFKKVKVENIIPVSIINMDEDKKLSDEKLLMKYLPNRKDWYKPEVEDVFVYKSETITSGKTEDGEEMPSHLFHYHKIDERADMWEKLCLMRPSLLELK